MQEVHSFEYAIIRVVPKVEREEFLNVGVILYCKSKKFLHTIINLDQQRLRSLSEKMDLADLFEHLKSLEQISMGTSKLSPIARLDIASRFRWLTASRSTIVQTSRVHPGICTDPMETIKKLYNELVLCS
ncbi:MAG: DUF3037 domain-containing protein [Flavitalea sp.]